jgi:CHAT domain-containing protein/tetratricopeptide (TPR) repeat protein
MKMKKQMISLLSFMLLFVFLGGCMTPTQMVDMGRSFKMMSWSKKEQHYQKLMNEGKYDELVEEYKKALENSKKKEELAPQIEKAVKISGIYENNLKDYSKAIEYGELALKLIEKGESLGPENEPDDHFYPNISPTSSEMYGAEWVRKTKITWYKTQRTTAQSYLWDAYKSIGDAKKAAIYQRKFTKDVKPAEEIMKEQAEEQAELSKKQKAYMEKRYGEKAAVVSSKQMKQIDSQMKESMERAAKRQERSNDLMVRMEKQAVRGDLQGVRISIKEITDSMHEDYRKTPGAAEQFFDAQSYSMGADYSYKYGLYPDAYEYGIKALNAIGQVFEFYRRHASKAFFASDRKKIMTQQTAQYSQNQIKCWLIAGKSLNRLGRYQEAIPYLNKAYEQKEVGYGMYFSMTSGMLPKMEALQELSCAYEHAGMNSEAIAAYEKMIEYFEDLRARLTRETHKIGFMGTQHQIYDKMIDLLLKEGRPSEALAYSERSRSRAFIDLLAGKELRPKSEKTKGLLTKKKSLEVQFADLDEQEIDDPSRVRGIQVVEKKMDGVMKELETEDAELFSMTTVKTLSTGEIQSMLDSDTALVEYHVTRNGLYAWVVTSDVVHVKSIDIPIWILADKVVQFREGVSKPGGQVKGRAKLEGTSRVRLEIAPKRFKNGELYTYGVYVKNNLPLFLTIDGLETKIGDWSYPIKEILEKEIPGGEEKQIIDHSVKWKITPGTHQVSLNTDQGDLASNVVEVKVDSEGVVSVEDKGYPEKAAQSQGDIGKYSNVSLCDILIKPIASYLNKKKVGIVPEGILHYVPFAALKDGNRYLIENHTLFCLPSATVLKFCREKQKVFGGKVLALGNPDLRNSQLDIPFAFDEVKAIGRLYPDSTVLVRGNATKSVFEDLAGSYDVLHLASHGVFDANKPLNSALLLSPEGNSDGRLTVSEIFDLDLSAFMVTLSACQSGMSRVMAGDEMMGLPRAFIYAGTPTVVASLWNVNDEATAILMKKFYGNLENFKKGDALREAQLFMIKNPKYEKPFYWAGFSLTGDYR